MVNVSAHWLMNVPCGIYSVPELKSEISTVPVTSAHRAKVFADFKSSFQERFRGLAKGRYFCSKNSVNVIDVFATSLTESG